MKMPAWLERAAPGSLGVFLGKTASRRKSGLFIRHLCRCFPEVFVDPRSLAALEAADRFEAGEIDEPAYQAVVAAAAEVVTATQPDRSNWQDRAVLSVAVAASIAQEVSARGYYPHVLTNLGRIVGNWGGHDPRRGNAYSGRCASCSLSISATPSEPSSSTPCGGQRWSWA